jgi:2-polyprenyl-3-methyl-5-hydroxy-6-metoxy-1,4-benzoquinol methylase
MNKSTKTIAWGEHLPKYKIPTVLKETLLKPYFENITFKEPVVDLGCGTGYFSEIVTSAGKKVLGIDKNGDLPNTDRFTFEKGDILEFKPKTKFNTVLLINILSTESKNERDLIIKKVYNLLLPGGTAYILNTSSRLFTSPTDSDLISFKKIAEDKVHLDVKLINRELIDFDDFIIQEEETRMMIANNNLSIIEEKEFQHPEMDRPVYILYVAKKK